MMGVQAASAQLFYDFCLDDHVPSDHLLRSIDGHLDFEGLRQTRPPETDQYAFRNAGRITPGMAAQAPPKQPFLPFSKTRRASPSDGILDGFFNGMSN
jgi:hypothetical protein